jgi:hypothetical protein
MLEVVSSMGKYNHLFGEGVSKEEREDFITDW